MNEHIYSIPFCNNCDISIGCSFNPGKGRGSRNSVMYITSHQTASDYKRGMGNGRNSKLIKEYNDSYNLEAYYTSLVKCISRGIPTEFEINNCIDYLKNEINICLDMKTNIFKSFKTKWYSLHQNETLFEDI